VQQAAVTGKRARSAGHLVGHPQVEDVREIEAAVDPGAHRQLVERAHQVAAGPPRRRREAEEPDAERAAAEQAPVDRGHRERAAAHVAHARGDVVDHRLTADRRVGEGAGVGAEIQEPGIVPEHLERRL